MKFCCQSAAFSALHCKQIQDIDVVIMVIMVINVFDAFSRQVYNKNTQKHTYTHSLSGQAVNRTQCIMYNVLGIFNINK